MQRLVFSFTSSLPRAADLRLWLQGRGFRSWITMCPAIPDQEEKILEWKVIAEDLSLGAFAAAGGPASAAGGKRGQSRRRCLVRLRTPVHPETDAEFGALPEDSRRLAPRIFSRFEILGDDRPDGEGDELAWATAEHFARQYGGVFVEYDNDGASPHHVETVPAPDFDSYKAWRDTRLARTATWEQFQDAMMEELLANLLSQSQAGNGLPAPLPATEEPPLLLEAVDQYAARHNLSIEQREKFRNLMLAFWKKWERPAAASAPAHKPPPTAANQQPNPPGPSSASNSTARTDEPPPS